MVVKIKFINPNPEKTKKYKKICLRLAVFWVISLTLGWIFGFNWVLN